jgi:hypothetical protein
VHGKIKFILRYQKRGSTLREEIWDYVEQAIDRVVALRTDQGFHGFELFDESGQTVLDTGQILQAVRDRESGS